MADSSQKIFYYSAPGKTIISGEHSVVYYKNALVMAIDLRTFCKATISKKENNPQSNPILVIENKQDPKVLMEITSESLLELLKTIINNKQEEDFSSLQKQFPEVEEKQLILSYLFLSVFLKVYGTEKSGQELIQVFNDKIVSQYKINVNLHSTLPISKGLGSSASYFTALSASLTQMFMHILEVNELKDGFQKFVNELAFSFEKIYHGTPSGIDNYIATYGNLLLFNKNHTSSIKVNKLPYKIFLIDSQIEKSTKKAVGRVREIYDDESFGTIGKQSIDMIGQVTDQIIQVVNNQDHFDQLKFENLVRINQSLLRLFDLSHSAIENIMRYLFILHSFQKTQQSYLPYFESICMKYEIAAKITGAGQGGNCIAFVPEAINESKEREFIQELETQGYEIIIAKLSVDGVREEK